MQKEITEKLIDRLCTDTENIFSLSPKISGAAKATPNFILLLEIVSFGTDYEESVNRLLQYYYFEYQYQDGLRALSNKAYELLFVGKSSSYNSRYELCTQILNQLGYNGNDFYEQNRLYYYIYERHQGINYRPSRELATKLCIYMGLDPAVYVPSKGEYREYLLQRQNELVKLLKEDTGDDDNKLEIKPDIQYQGMTRDMKELLFDKFSSFIEKTFTDAWEDRIDKNKLCSETQELTTGLREYRKVVNS